MKDSRLPACGATIEQFAKTVAAAEYRVYQEAQQYSAQIEAMSDNELQRAIDRTPGLADKPSDHRKGASASEYARRLKWLRKANELLRSGKWRATGIPEGRYDRIEIDQDILARAGWMSHYDFERSIVTAAGRTFDGVRVFDRSTWRQRDVKAGARQDGLPPGSRNTNSRDKSKATTMLRIILTREAQYGKVRHGLQSEIKEEFERTKRTGTLGPIVTRHLPALLENQHLKTEAEVLERINKSSGRAISDAFPAIKKHLKTQHILE
jgi:hypothetical protein